MASGVLQKVSDSKAQNLRLYDAYLSRNEPPHRGTGRLISSRRTAAAVMIAGAIVAVPTVREGDKGILSTDVTLVLPPFQEIGNGKGRVAVPVLADPSPRDPVHGYALELVEGDRFDVRSLDMKPSDVKGRC